MAKKLGRRFVGVEIDEHYCCLAEKRLAMATSDAAIQGYRDGVFWERNTLAEQVQCAGPLPGSDTAPVPFPLEVAVE